ncbi:MAG: DUF6383 domain-containing protein [Paludibacteraceae bacterium]|nr:DUF6383 domain-containing protein [Paludibacteraceae bacterium]
MKKFTFILLCIVHCALCINLSAQVECQTIAEIKSQPDKTKILYTGTATTTFYNGTYNGLFMEDETGGILLKGYTLNGKKSDWVTDSMEVTNITATWSVGSTGTTPGITVANADKKTPECTFDVAFTPARITMAEFFENKAAYECKAIVITDAVISPKVASKNYLVNGADSLVFQVNNVASIAPAGGEMAGAFVGNDYNRFLLCSGELTKATEFYSFSDMAAYYNGKNYEIVDAKVGGAVLVNYVTKLADNRTAIFAQYLGLIGLLNNGITIFVDGETSVAAGDSINGFYGKYVDAYKHKTDVKEFKGAYFTQAAEQALNVLSSNNPEVVAAGVNISDLLTNKLCMNHSAQIIASRYNGKLYAKGDKYYYKVTYEMSNPGEDSDGFISVSDSIVVVGANGLDLSKHVGNNIIISGVYDAAVVYAEPTIIVRDAKDILITYYEFNNIAELMAAGEPLSAGVIYGLKGEVIVNYKRTQVNSGVSQTWIFIEDETAALAVDLGAGEIDAVVGDKIKGLKGVYDDGLRYGSRQEHAPSFVLSQGVVPEIVSRNNEINFVKASLSEVIADTLKYCSHVVEISNLGGTFQTISDLTGVRDDYYLYDMANPTAEMHYTPSLHTGNAIIGENITLKGLSNFNCLDGYYVIYRISVSGGTNVGLENNNKTASIYTTNGMLCIETEAGQTLEVYTIDGHQVYQTTNSSNFTEIADLSGVIIIKINGETYKTVIR